jgi:predicted MFS family arabinose efflux permease
MNDEDSVDWVLTGGRGMMSIRLRPRFRGAREASQPARSASLRANRDFLMLMSGQGVSTLGSKACGLAFPLLALELTHSPARAGVLGFVSGLPVLLIQLPAGALVDRWDRKRVMVVCDVGRLLVMVSIPAVALLFGLSFSFLLITAFINAGLSVVFSLAEYAALPHVVDADSIPAAVARNQTVGQATTVAGQPLGGWLFSLSPVVPFVANAVSYVVSLITLVAIRGRLYDPPAVPKQPLHREIAAGVRFVWSQRLLRALVVLSTTMTLLTGGFTLVVIVLLGRLGASPTEIGMIFGGCGVAGLAGALVTPRLVARLAPGWLYLASVAASAVLVGLMALARSPLWAGVVAAGIVALGPLPTVIVQTRRARLIPRHLFGRVYSVEMVASGATAPLACLLSGALLSVTSPATTCLLIGGGLLALTAAATASPAIRRPELPDPREAAVA